MWYHFNIFDSALYALILQTASIWFPTGSWRKQGKNAPGADGCRTPSPFTGDVSVIELDQSAAATGPMPARRGGIFLESTLSPIFEVCLSFGKRAAGS
jgi:hypothetical protein